MEYIVIFAPLMGFLIAGLFGRLIGDRAAQVIPSLLMLAAAGASLYLIRDVVFAHDPRTLPLMIWFAAGGFEAEWALRFDSLSVVMMAVVTVVSACVHIYSIGYMSHDPGKARFMAYLSLFTFAMLMLVSADNLLQLFFGWEGVGLASYLLIGFWHHKDSANAAAMKAFLVNRVGDVGLVLGISAIFLVFGTVQFDAIFAQAPSHAGTMIGFFGYELHALTLCALLLFLGAMGKSAQLGLHTWLPDAMEGPTPVSALIHAATMVTAGVFLVARFSPLYEYAPVALAVITVVGALTALIAATIGLTQFDIKRVIAYSTMSQLGYMFFALGVSAYSAAMFHLVTHAFFKALLFLGAGSVIHALSDEQDMRKMGGVWKQIPVTYALMWIGSLALAGIPVFAGYYSKDLILEAAWADHTGLGQMAYILGVAAALLTALYSWRLIIMTFHGRPRADEKVMAHVHESPPVMLRPLYVLALGAVFAGMLMAPFFVGHERSMFWGETLFVMEGNDTVEAAHHVEKWVKYLPVAVALLGIALAYLLYMFARNMPKRIRKTAGPVYALFYRKYFFDEIYNIVFTRGAWRLGRALFKWGDGVLINGLGPDGFSALARGVARRFSDAQTGYIFHYAFIMMAALIGLVGWIVFQR